MKCSKCGSEISSTASFCESCGEPVSRTELPEGEYVTENIIKCADGKYRWVYEYRLMKNPLIAFTIWKIFAIILLVPLLLGIVSDGIRWGFKWENVLPQLKIFGFIYLGMTALVLISYFIYAAYMGFKYCVMFEMDEKGIRHIQMPSQVKKAQALSDLTILAGAASGRISTVAAGMAARKTESYSQFDKVRRVKAYPMYSTLKVNETLEHNQIYAEKADFEFVKDFIISHCPNLK